MIRKHTTYKDLVGSIKDVDSCETWLMRPSFHGLSCEKDPVLGDAEKGVCSYTTPSREGPVGLLPMPAFVKTIGGGYFFLPGKRLIQYLAE
jgi:hypothetical protein